MYEELVGALRKRAMDLPEKFSRNAVNIDLLMKAADAIEELSKPKWIPVTERLPEKDIPVFVYLFGDSPYIAWINYEGEWETEEFTIDRDYLPQAWMPLPEPPKEET